MRANPLVVHLGPQSVKTQGRGAVHDESHLPDAIDPDAAHAFAREVERADNAIRSALADVRSKGR